MKKIPRKVRTSTVRMVRGLALRHEQIANITLDENEQKLINYLLKKPLASVFELYFCARIDTKITLEDYENILEKMQNMGIVVPINVHPTAHLGVVI